MRATAIPRFGGDTRRIIYRGRPHRDGERLYNSAVAITPGGEILARYHKVQLAEAWPTAGNQLLVFRVDGVPASIIICHDERYPELVRLPVLAGARLVFYLSHESELAAESKLAPYRAQIQARAVENTVYIVQANAPANADATGSHGQSRLVAPDGNLIQEASIFGEDVIVATLNMERARGRQGKAERGPEAHSETRGAPELHASACSANELCCRLFSDRTPPGACSIWHSVCCVLQ